MSISQKDIKLLWGRAASRCAVCKQKLAFDRTVGPGAQPFGEMAHIVANRPDGPRGTSPLSSDERDSYSNLILLCPTHHAIVDGSPDEYPIERLFYLKSQHELWVDEHLSEAIDLRRQATEAIYASLVDAAVEQCQLSRWEKWTSWALSSDPRWDRDAPERLFQLRQKVMASPWPGTLPELERALQTLSITLQNAVLTFQLHSDLVGQWLIPDKFYKSSEWNPNRYNRLAARYDSWLELCHDLVFEATRAANWMADTVRRDLNPMFVAVEGKFLVTHGPFAPPAPEWRTELLEYSPEERAALPALLGERWGERLRQAQMPATEVADA